MSDRISVRWSAADPELTAALVEHRALISGEVLAVDFGPGAAGAEADGDADARAETFAQVDTGPEDGERAETGETSERAERAEPAESAESADAGSAEARAHQVYRHESVDLGLTFWIMAR